MSKDLDKSVSSVISIAPALIASTATGTGVDLAGYDKAAVIFITGVVTDGTHTPKLQESDSSGSGYSDVGASDQSGALVALTAGTQEIGYLGSKRYIRAVVTVTGSPGTGATYCAQVVRGGARTEPV